MSDEQRFGQSSLRAHCRQPGNGRGKSDWFHGAGQPAPRSHLRRRSLSVLFLRWKVSSRWRERRVLTGRSREGCSSTLPPSARSCPCRTAASTPVSLTGYAGASPATDTNVSGFRRFPRRCNSPRCWRGRQLRSSCWAPTRPITAYAGGLGGPHPSGAESAPRPRRADARGPRDARGERAFSASRGVAILLAAGVVASSAARAGHRRGP